MDLDRWAKRLGALLIIGCMAARLLGDHLAQPLLQWLQNPDVQSFLIYLETGRNVRFSPSLEENANFDGESPGPALLPAALPCFSAADAANVDMTNASSCKPDLETLMALPLNWDLSGTAPTVLILHTHATESYTKSGENYEESGDFRTLDENYNMLSIGDAVAELLSQRGIAVIHDRELHDYPSYNGSYNHARKSIAYYLERYPSIRLILDLHRDASGDLDNQYRTLATVDGQDSAQLMLVIGTNAGGLYHPNWEDNLAVGLKLHTQLERLAPGITRPLNLRAQRFNQDLLPGALLVEVGAAGNTHPEALRAAKVLAEAVAMLAKGSQ